MVKTKSDENNPKLEDSIQALEKIVQELEKGQLGLDESLKTFEEGVKLYRNCRSKLEEAEKKIKILTDDLKEENWQE